MFEIMIPSPLSFLVMFEIMIPSPNCRSMKCLVINLKSVVVSSNVRDYDSKSFVVLCGV